MKTNFTAFEFERSSNRATRRDQPHSGLHLPGDKQARVEHWTELMTQKEYQLLRNIRKLVVSQQNTMASVMELMKLSQDF